MKRTYYILLTLLSVAVLSWVLPWLVSLCFPQNHRDPFVSWSPVNDRFIISMPVDNIKDEPEIFDLDPNGIAEPSHYTRDERDSLLPEMYVSQLNAKGLMPDSIKGVEMTMQNVRRNSWVFTSTPRTLNRSVPAVYPLLESMPARFSLEDPTVAMTLYDDGLEIIDIETNTTDEIKTKRFANMFRDKEFSFPAREAVANVTTRKGYDNGYLIVDNDGKLFHVKMQVSRPSMARIELPEGLEIDHVWILENADRALYGLVSGTDGSLWAIEHDDYRLMRLPDVTFNPETERMTIFKALFSWVIKVNDDNSATWTALDAQDGKYSTLGVYTYTYPANRLAEIESWIFPFTVSFTSPLDLDVKPRFEGYSWNAMALGALLALVFLFMRRRDSNRKCTAACTLLILVCGLYAFIPLILFKK